MITAVTFDFARVEAELPTARLEEVGLSWEGSWAEAGRKRPSIP